MDMFYLIKKHKFWSNKNITITPHVAAITDHDSSIGYLYKRFMDFKKNKTIKRLIKQFLK